MDNATVVKFPKGRRQRAVGKTGDERLVADIRRAWKKLARTIRAAEAAGLTVETDFYVGREPKITRRL